MYVCLCNAVTDRQIAQAMRSGCRDVADLGRELGVGTGCGSCVAYTEALIADQQTPATPHIRPDTDLFYPA